VPALMVLGAVVIALGLIEADSRINRETLAKWPRFFGASAEGARNILSAIAGSMITVAGVTFSITIVALSLASNQYTPRILRNFMRDRANQLVLGIFVSIFIYCLVVLRTIRGGEEAFVPSLAVVFAIVLAVVSIGFFIYFIHHMATSIQASSIIASVAGETIQAITFLFPERVGDELDEPAPDERVSQIKHKSWAVVPSPATGYIQGVNPDALVKFAEQHKTVLRMERGVGEFVVEGMPLASLLLNGELDPKLMRTVSDIYAIDEYRTVGQDAGFGVRQLVDIALKALSPGVNDTTTAVTCVDYLGAILCCLAERRIPPRFRYSQGELRVIARGPTFDSLVDEAFHQIRQNSAGNVAVILRMLQTVMSIAGRTRNEPRRRTLWGHVELIMDVSDRSIGSAHDRLVVYRCVTQVADALGQKAPEQPLAFIGEGHSA
jgi:uncharacterized membrane protein